MKPTGKPLVWLHAGERLEIPHSRPMPGIGQRCHELRVVDANATCRSIYRIDRDAVVIAEVSKKKSQTTRQSLIEISRKRLREYDNA